MEGSTKGLQLSMYNERRRNLPKGASLPGFSVAKVRRGDNVNWLGDVLVPHPAFGRISFWGG